ncbi:hypothetical protein Peur_014763 [Populus x canadensis]|jgi:hypothetical protein
MDLKMETKNVAGREMCCCCELCSSVALGLENNMQARLLDLGLLLLLLAVERDTCCLLTVEPELLMKINLCCYYEMVGPANRGGAATAILTIDAEETKA